MAETTLHDLRDLGGAGLAEATATPQREPKIDALGRSYATGKRKNAIARVWIKPDADRSSSTAGRSRRSSRGQPCG